VTLALALLLGCDDPEGDGEDDDTIRIEGRRDTGDTGRNFRVAARFVHLDVTCRADGAAVSVRADRETGGVAVLDVWDTASDAGWSEEHLLVATGSGTQGERLDAPLPPDSLACSDGATFAVRLYDRDDRLTDCVALGHLPGCVWRGDCGEAGGLPALPGELAECVAP
jgi:hypothetical protein